VSQPIIYRSGPLQGIGIFTIVSAGANHQGGYWQINHYKVTQVPCTSGQLAFFLRWTDNGTGHVVEVQQNGANLAILGSATASTSPVDTKANTPIQVRIGFDPIPVGTPTYQFSTGSTRL